MELHEGTGRSVMKIIGEKNISQRERERKRQIDRERERERERESIRQAEI